MVRHALSMMAGTCVSRVLGLAREVMTAAFFGASGQLDAFNVAYTLANTARQLVAEGALSAAFVPVFSRALETGRVLGTGHARALSLARQAMSVLIAASSGVTLLGMLGAPLLTLVMAPGFDAETSLLTTNLTRWMFPFLFLISLAALAMGTLNSLGSFFVPALAPAFSNLIFIVSAPFFVRRFGILGLAFSVLAGGFAHFASQWLWGRRIGAALFPERPDFSDPDLRRMMALFLPYAAGLSLNQVNPVVSRMLASFLEEGSISVLNYANRVIQLPLGLFVIAVSQAVLPQLSRAERPEDFTAVIGDALRFALFIVLPTACGLIFTSGAFVHLIFVRGAFGESAWRATSWALGLSALGLPGMACSTVVMRGLYALSMPRAAFMTTLFSVSCTAVLSFLLMFPMGCGGLALAPSVAFSLSGLLGLFYIRRKTGRPLRIFPPAWIFRVALALASMLAVLSLYLRLTPYVPSASLSARAAWCMGAAVLGALVYAAATLACGFDEWRWIKDAVARKRKK
ncbi:MAG: murein biosynthesis integral membrane protein MurJ [Synergistaceae bacterium]|jgi:putative peptidoglycan lipid II flippase|nr:murein biosynthesis integral membrane protein MurJ [Synergistaceae bacterium]